MLERKKGNLKKIFSDKGYGFIQAHKKDVFFHVTDSEGLDINSLREGITVSYEESQDARSGKTKAINVTVEKQ